VCAAHLQLLPNLTPEEMQNRIIGDTKSVMYTTGSDTDYSNFTRSLMGAENRVLYNKYGKQPATVNNISISGGLTVTTN